jgi:Domain of unknown function (DUF4369)
MKILLLTLLTICTIKYNVTAQDNLKGKYKIKGECDASLKGKAYLRYADNINKRLIVDSAELKKGVFKLNGNIAEPMPASLILAIKDSLTKKTTQYIFPFFIDASNDIDITINNNLTGIKAKGSDSYKDFLQLRTNEGKEKQKVDSIRLRIARHTAKKDTVNQVLASTALLAAQNNLNEKVYKPFIDKNKKSVVSLFVLWQMYTSKTPVAELKPLFKKLDDKVQDLPSGKELWQRIK